MGVLDEQIESYIRNLSKPFEGTLGTLQQFAYDNSFPVISPDTARFLSTMAAIKQPGKVLEIGCCIGFSAGIMAKYLKEGGSITTIDRYDIMIEQAKKSFTELGIEDKVTLLEGDALEIVPKLAGTFDFIFLDAAKGQYLQLLPHLIRLLEKGGILLADDIFQNGYIAMDRFSVPRRQRTIHSRMRSFLQIMTHTDGLESAFIPLDDGLLMCIKLQEDVQVSLPEQRLENGNKGDL